ncbi:uncharacterized protein LOC119570945 [Penaeus monodon]|uniref:uncharacterized protein LOC119570945 n=1 Tax=Penaeus monodon TaxID=6687 RepID=UPI0018A7D933|nr:uncharacterized protein LOC119570945 [Penaeus monodon]
MVPLPVPSSHCHRRVQLLHSTPAVQEESCTVALSRVSIDAVHLGLNCNQLAKGQQQDPKISACRTFITSLKWKDVSVDEAGTTCGFQPPSVVTFQPHPQLVPSLLISDSTPSEAEICLAKDWVRYCTACQTSKIQLHTEMGPRSFHQPKRRFTHIHVDIMGPLPLSEGHRYLFTIVGRPTRCSTCATALLSGWILRFSIPTHITSDQGTLFTSQLWMSLGQLLGTSIHHTTAYNPEANSMVESFYRNPESCPDVSM